MLLNLLFSQPAPSTPSAHGSASALPVDALQNLSGDELAQISQPLLDQFPQFAQWLGALETDTDATPKPLPEWIQGIPKEVVAEIHEEIRETGVRTESTAEVQEMAIRVLTAGLSHLLQQQPPERSLFVADQPLQKLVTDQPTTQQSETHHALQNPIQGGPATPSQDSGAVLPQRYAVENQAPLQDRRPSDAQPRTRPQNPVSVHTPPPAPAVALHPTTGEATSQLFQTTANPSDGRAPSASSAAPPAGGQVPVPLASEQTVVRQEPVQQRTDPPAANATQGTPAAGSSDGKATVNQTTASQAASLTVGPTLTAQKEQQQRSESEQRAIRSQAPQADKPATATKIADTLPAEMTPTPKNLPPKGTEQSVKTELDKLYPSNNQNLTSESKSAGPRDALLGERMPTQPQSSTLPRPESQSSGREFAMDNAATNRPAATASTSQATPAHRAQPGIWTQQITDTWERMRTDGVSRMTVQIQLNHNERISVELRLQGQVVQTRFFTESEGVRLGLQQNWDELTARFAERGARLEIPQFQNTNPSTAFRNDFGQQASSGNGSQSRQNRETNAEDPPTPNKAPKSKVPATAGPANTSTLSAWA